MAEVNQATIDLVKRFEGVHDGDKRTAILEPQPDPIGIPTLGYGAIYDRRNRRVTIDTPAITLDEAEGLLARDLSKAARYVRALVPEMSENKIGALTSFTYNLGRGAFKSSTLLKRVRLGEWDDVPYQLDRWVFAGGRRLPGLVARRRAEAELWSTKTALTEQVVLPAAQPETSASATSFWQRTFGSWG